MKKVIVMAVLAIFAFAIVAEGAQQKSTQSSAQSSAAKDAAKTVSGATTKTKVEQKSAPCLPNKDGTPCASTPPPSGSSGSSGSGAKSDSGKAKEEKKKEEPKAKDKSKSDVKNVKYVQDKFETALKKYTNENLCVVLARSSTWHADNAGKWGDTVALNLTKVAQSLALNVVQPGATVAAKMIIRDALDQRYKDKSDAIIDYTAMLMANDYKINALVWASYGYNINPEDIKSAGILAMTPNQVKKINKDFDKEMSEDGKDAGEPNPGGGGPTGGEGSGPGVGGAKSGGGDAATSFGECLLAMAGKVGGAGQAVGANGGVGNPGGKAAMPSGDGIGTGGTKSKNDGSSSPGSSGSGTGLPCAELAIYNPKGGGGAGKACPSGDCANDAYNYSKEQTKHEIKAEKALKEKEKALKEAGKQEKYGNTENANYFKEKAAEKNEEAKKEGEKAFDAEKKKDAAIDEAYKEGDEKGEDAEKAAKEGAADAENPPTGTETPTWEGGGGSNSTCGKDYENCGEGSDNSDPCAGNNSGIMLAGHMFTASASAGSNAPILPTEEKGAQMFSFGCGSDSAGGSAGGGSPIDMHILYGSSTLMGAYDPSPLGDSEPIGGGGGSPTPPPYSSPGIMKDKTQQKTK